MAAAAVSRGALKPVGHTQVHGSRGHVPKGAGGAGWCHCKAALDHLGNARAKKEFSGDGKKTNIASIFNSSKKEHAGNCRLVSHL